MIELLAFLMVTDDSTGFGCIERVLSLSSIVLFDKVLSCEN